MKRFDFEQNFDLLLETAGSVTKLRRMILQLAVMGKLVPQDPGDEPASVLLKRIHEEREKLIAEEKIKRPKPLPPIDESNWPFNIPSNWEWVRLGDLCTKTGAGSTPLGGASNYVPVGIAFLRSQNVWNHGIKLDGVARIPDSIHERMGGTHVLAGDILLNITGASIGRAAIVPPQFESANVSQHVAIIRLVEVECGPIVQAVLISDYGNNCIMDSQAGISREGLSMGNLQKIMLPFPPLAEQKRIVAKVDSLMQLCDELEQKQEQRGKTRLAFVKSTFTNLPADESNESPSGFADGFDRLVQAPTDVPELRKAILQLAIMGKLVPQDPGDEPASVLLEKIREEREQLIAEEKIKRPKALPAVEEEEVPYEVPTGWELCALEELTVLDIRNGYSPRGVEHVTRTKSLALSAITSGKFDGSRIKYLDEIIEHDSYLWLEPQDILIQRSNSLEYVGVSALYTGRIKEYVFPDLMMRIRTSQSVSAQYVQFSLASRTSREYFRANASGTSGSMPKINQSTVRRVPVPLPPLAEQKRIVAKVDKLIQLCDELESKLTLRETTGEELMDAVVHSISNR